MYPYLVALGGLAVATTLLVSLYDLGQKGAPAQANIPLAAPATQAAVVSAATSNASATIATSTTPTATTSEQVPIARPEKDKDISQKTTTATSSDEAVRIEDPYPFPPQAPDTLNATTRGALVNILCTPRSGMLRPISGSGVVIDPRGVILTNAHVAQYVLLSRDPRIDLSCYVRTGSPAKVAWTPRVLYLPPVWVAEHAHEINTERPVGTGEHDYALLTIDTPANGAPLPASTGLPFVPIDTREAIGFQDDTVLVASYPAEFTGGLVAQLNLYAASSFTTIKQLLTFHMSTVDAFSLGGVIEAQSGSSGGAVVNQWGRLVGLISTTSSGNTTAERDLRAITTGYINRDIAAQTGRDLGAVLKSDLTTAADSFDTNVAPGLIATFFAHLTR